MAGNVKEWTERIDGGWRGLRGGSWVHGEDFMRSSDSFGPTVEFSFIGFRVASSYTAVIPEPSTVGLLLAASAAIRILRAFQRRR